MPTIRYIMLISAIGISAIGFAMLLEGHGYLLQPLPSLVESNDVAVRDGMKVTARFQITLQENPTMTYTDTEQFIQGQHLIPPGLEQQTAGMQPGESKTFPLSAEDIESEPHATGRRTGSVRRAAFQQRQLLTGIHQPIGNGLRLLRLELAVSRDRREFPVNAHQRRMPGRQVEVAGI